VVRFQIGENTVTSHSNTDSFGRKTFDELQLGAGFVSREFDYVKGSVTEEHLNGRKLKSTPTTHLVERILYSDGRTIAYEYDAEERITKVTDSIDGTTEYTYDVQGQLLTERLNGHIVNAMEYDGYGNIVKKNNAVYTYGDTAWKDLLTSYNGQAIEYDAQGNPTSYLGHTLTWEKGRQLKSFDGNSYTYNANGIRTSKTVNGVKHEYTLDGTKVLREVWNDNTLTPLYDNEDSVCGIDYNGFAYYFQKNLQGDVIAITNSYGNVVARYTYDAWGVCTVVSDETGIIARVNPFRYRGYYYDSEIGLYYLQSRYYDPTVGRFISADTAEVLEHPPTSQTTNLFSYCNNDPTDNTDSSGLFLASKLAEIFLSAIFGVVAQLFDDTVTYFLKVLVYGKRNIPFPAKPSDYASRALSWALECINPFSGKKKILNVIFAVVPVVIKTIWDLAAGKKFDLWSILRNIFYSLLSVIVSEILGWNKKREMSQIKKKYRGRKPEYDGERLRIRAKYKTLGKRFDICVDIVPAVTETILSIIFVQG